MKIQEHINIFKEVFYFLKCLKMDKSLMPGQGASQAIMESKSGDCWGPYKDFGNFVHLGTGRMQDG